MFGHSCDRLPVASIPISPTSGSSSTAFLCYSSQFISISTTTYPSPPQGRSILKLLSSFRGVKNLHTGGGDSFSTVLRGQHIPRCRRNSLLVSLIVCAVAELEGKAFVHREKCNYGDSIVSGHARTQDFETVVSIASCPGLLILKDDRLCEVEDGASPANLNYDLESVGSIVADKEKLRRERISRQNKGKVPWNKGKKHSPETIQRIRQRTSQAMLRPNVREKLVQNASKPMGDEIKKNIRKSLLSFHEKRKQLKLQQLACLEDWKNEVAEAAKIGDEVEEELQWNSYSLLAIQLKLEFIQELRDFKKKKKEQSKELVGKTENHRKSISDAITEKWKDPEYRTKARMGRQKYFERLNSEVKVKKPRSTSRTSKNKMLYPELEHMTVRSKPVAPYVDTAFAAEVMWGETQFLSKTKSVAISGHFNRALGDSLGPYKGSNMLPLAQEKSLTEQQPLSTSANGHAKGTLFASETPINSENICSYVDSNASEKLEKLRKLRASRLAAERARLLMMEAERAAKALEIAAESNHFAKASLAETRRLLAEAAQSIKNAESKNMIELEFMCQGKTGSDAVDAAKLLSASSPARSMESHVPSGSSHFVSKVEQKLSDSNVVVNAFDLVDSWILYENPETSRKSPLKSMRKIFRPEEHSVLQSTAGDETTALRLMHFTDQSSPHAHHLQNLKDCHSILPKGVPKKSNAISINWNIKKEAKSLKMWHCGRLLAVENKA